MPDHRTLRFRALVTLGMRLISLRDRLLLDLQSLRTASRHTPLAELSIASSNARSLQAVFHPTEAPRAAVLILHGIGDRLAYWREAQELLAKERIASLIFHYAGYGRSTGAITPHNLSVDTHAAYAHLRTLLPAQTPLFALGFSLGTGVLADALNQLAPSPDGVILCQPFSSLRRAATKIFAPLSWLVPDLWPTADTLRTLPCPLLLVHTDADALFPLSMSKEIEAAALSQTLYPVTLAVPAGFAHNDVYLHPSAGYWQPILRFIETHSRRAANSSKPHPAEIA